MHTHMYIYVYMYMWSTYISMYYMCKVLYVLVLDMSIYNFSSTYISIELNRAQILQFPKFSACIISA